MNVGQKMYVDLLGAEVAAQQPPKKKGPAVAHIVYGGEDLAVGAHFIFHRAVARQC